MKLKTILFSCCVFVFISAPIHAQVIFGWGYNAYGQLGDANTANKKSPTQIGTASDWMQIANGADHCVALKKNGTLWTWGYNCDGQLGDATFNNASIPKQIGTATNWTQVACGSFHTLALKSNGTLWGCGLNNRGELGNGTTTPQITSFIQIGTATNWKYIACGEITSFGIKTDGTLWSWGLNYFGELGTGPTGISCIVDTPQQVGTDTNWDKIESGSNHTLAIKTDGSLWGWGRNVRGEVGKGDQWQQNYPIQIGTDTDWKQVSCAMQHSAALKNDGTLWTWGSNYNGQLGDGTNTNVSSPMQVGTANDWSFVTTGYFNTLGIKTDGTLWLWGSNTYNQLADGTTTTKKSPFRIGTATDWITAAIGDGYVVASKSSLVISVQETLNNTFRVYPNPVENGFYIKGIDEKATISISDISASLYLQQTVSIDESIPTTNLPTGVYILTIQTSDKTEQIKFIKK